MIRFSFNLACSESNVIFKWRKKKPKQTYYMFLTEKKELKFTALRDGITCAVYVRTTSIDLSDFPLIIN